MDWTHWQNFRPAGTSEEEEMFDEEVEKGVEALKRVDKIEEKAAKV
jgi:hypothetical protein